MRYVSPTTRRQSGFTLIEAALTTAIVSFGVMGMLQLLAAGTISNADGTDMTMGLNLARNVRELMVGLPNADPVTPTHWGAEAGETLATYNDLDDFADKSYSPPIDARRQTLANYPNWTQSIKVQNVDTNLLTSVVPNGSSPAIRVTVTITHNGKYVCDMSWVQFDALP